MGVKRYEFKITTDGSGAGSRAIEVNGEILQITYRKPGSNPLDNAAALTVKALLADVTILALANAGTASFTKAPRQTAHAAADGADLVYASGGEPVEAGPYCCAGETLSVAITGGGATKDGTFHVYVRE